MAIRSPYNSFVDFNTDLTDCSGNTRQAALPVIDNFGVKFQIKVEDELVISGTPFYAAVCSEDCETIYDPEYEVIEICNRHKFVDTNGHSLSDDDFPLLVGNYSPDPGQPQIPEGSYTREEFLTILSDYYEYTVPGFDFIDCCDVPVITGIVVFYNGAGLAKELNLNAYYGYGYVNFPATDMSGIVGAGECFRYCILNSGGDVLACSSLFYRETKECFTSVITYYNEENGYDFKYVTYDDNGTTRITENQIRVPFYLRRPGFTVEENVFRQSNQVRKRTSTQIDKTWQGVVGYLSDLQHEKLVVALKHDVVTVENTFSNVNQRMSQEGEYTITWPDDSINTALNPAEFTIYDYSQSHSNNNCGFECGVEIIDECEGGGVIPSCPDKFSVEFTLTEGQASYQNDNLIGLSASQMEVYREGLIQYTTGGNSYSVNAGTGTVTFNPVGYAGERIAIIEI